MFRSDYDDLSPLLKDQPRKALSTHRIHAEHFGCEPFAA
jgi:hypothetical protein